MSMSKTFHAHESSIEPSIEIVREDFVTPEEKFRMTWAESSGDWAWQICKFLQGRRINEVSLAEIEQTKTCARATEFEKSSLRFVAAQAEQRYPLSEDDRIRLRERDNFVMKFVNNRSLGHRDWVSEILNIPAVVRRAQEVDAALFPKTWRELELFGWIWKTR
jgi:hypothetical protein